VVREVVEIGVVDYRVALSAGPIGWPCRLALSAGLVGWPCRLALSAGLVGWPRALCQLAATSEIKD